LTTLTSIPARYNSGAAFFSNTLRARLKYSYLKLMDAEFFISIRIWREKNQIHGKEFNYYHSEIQHIISCQKQIYVFI